MKVHVLSILLQSVWAAKPIARHLTYHVAPGNEIVIALQGYDIDGDTLTAKVATLPETGSLHQLSQVFSTHGYDPKAESESILTASMVTGSQNRVVYKRPKIDMVPANGKFAEFRYTVSDGVDESKEGIVLISVSASTMSSTFDTGIDGWNLYSNSPQTQPSYQKSSQGLLSYYIYGTDALIQTNDAGDDLKLWYFDAPSQFRGNHWEIYNGYLQFVLSASVGDFSADKLNNDAKSEFIVLDCATCNLNSGIRLVRRLDTTLTFDGKTKQFSIALNEASGWLKDSKSTIVAFAPPTQCEFVQVLSNLSAVQILGDFTRGYETVAIDSIAMIHGDGQPIACYA